MEDRKGVRVVEGSVGRILLLSMRRIHDLVAFCLAYEFEDVVAEVTGADRIEPEREATLELFRRVYKLTRYATRSTRLAHLLTPPPPHVRLERDYELFFPVFNHPHELFALASIQGWRERCQKAACFVSEAWPHLLPRYLIELLRPFDHVFLGVHGCVEKVAELIERPCSYLPLAVDVLRFSPHPGQPPERVIDVCNIGRRSVIAHDALLALARGRRIFYYYDTVAASGTNRLQRTFRVDDPAAHRLLLANLLRRSRFFIANRARVNEAEFTYTREEISSRFYEGAAAGTVMLGEAPRTKEFQHQFDWPDALLPIEFDSPYIARVLEDLVNDPDRMARISAANSRNAALRHDWVHRLRTVFDNLGLRATAGMLSRDESLRMLAAQAGQPYDKSQGGGASSGGLLRKSGG